VITRERALVIGQWMIESETAHVIGSPHLTSALIIRKLDSSRLTDAASIFFKFFIQVVK
jgi:hypothetical protein